jgi:hypothetical protein
MNRAGRILLAAARALLLSVLAWPLACAVSLTSQVAPTGPTAPAKAADSPVAIFFSAVGPPDRPYVEVGRIRVESTASLDPVLREAEMRARQLGADGIIVDLRYHYQSLPVSFDAAGTPQVPVTPRLNANAIAIRYVPGLYPPANAGAR